MVLHITSTILEGNEHKYMSYYVLEYNVRKPTFSHIMDTKNDFAPFRKLLKY